MSDHHGCGRICSVALGLAFAVVWAFVVVLMGLMAMNGSYGQVFVHFVGSFYIGYASTSMGIFIGFIWAFLDAFFCGLIVAWLYNLFAGHCCKCLDK